MESKEMTAAFAAKNGTGEHCAPGVLAGLAALGSPDGAKNA